MIRLFVALKIPDDVINKIIQYRNEAAFSNQNLNWENKEKLHLTLKFIGNVREELTDKINDALLFTENFNSIKFSFTKFGFFFRDNYPKILWLGLSNNDELIMLVEKIEGKLEPLGIQSEKRTFKPHLTLLRIKNKLDNNFINSFENFKLPNLNFVSNEISLIKSELFSDTSRYTEIKKYKLKDLEEK